MENLYPQTDTPPHGYTILSLMLYLGPEINMIIIIVVIKDDLNSQIFFI